MHSKERSVMEPTFPQRRRTPSFSSSLLDAIYRSIDEPNDGKSTAMTRKQSEACVECESSNSAQEGKEKRINLRRAMLIEKWVEKRSSFGGTSSMSSSSDSSYGGFFSSSDADSYGSLRKKRSSRSSRSEKCLQPEKINQNHDEKEQKKKPENEVLDGKFAKTKLKALKIYGELKKGKQPISPGARLTSFLNSIFNSNAKKVKICSVGAMEDVSFERKTKASSSCSSAASFSRSCFSGTPSTSTRSNNSKTSDKNSIRRSVRFYPVSIIVDEDLRPCGHKSIHQEDPSLMPSLNAQNIVKRSTKEGLKIDPREVAYATSNCYQRNDSVKFDLKNFVDNYKANVDDDDDDDDEEEDVWSCSSSDLFELDHRIGTARYREELPVYETTDLKTNQAIAKGLIL